MLDFHISRSARARYNVDASLFSLRGTLIFGNFYAARLLAQQINQERGEQAAVQAGELNALGLIHEIMHALMQQYRQQHGDVMARAVETLYANLGEDAVERTLRVFVDEFPPLPVYRGEQTIEQYLSGSSVGIPNREIVLDEMILVWLQNQNPAASPFKELFDDTALRQSTDYSQIVTQLREFYAAADPVGPSGQSLFDALMAPLVNAPTSLAAQLEYMLSRWSAVAGRFDVAQYFSRVVGGMQFIQEEQKFLWQQQAATFGGGGGGGFTATTPPVPTFRREFQSRIDPETGKEVWFEPEPEQFSLDLDWMPNLVLIAKSTYVWLDQLSKKYGRSITRLDQIPDEELDELRARGITGLWFIGVWERSKASAEIKHMMGNAGAIASAYSLYDYEIAQELGGAEALEALKVRAWRRGIRLASDMVPNHMGIDSRWVMEHPEWFISSPVPPYPAYSFTGPDLSQDTRVTVQIEDHYFDKTDAAVVFKRTDKYTEEERFIFHGNDGTSFPWNDTAQLNYLLPEVREQVIQTILKVARQTPVIRFDAAMTLAKRHYQRLWYPLPGTTDSIPSRNEYSMTKAEFDAAMPEEFWREVVDRVAMEAPDTLLLAEAFWMMEGYFVRTLGMHRVYNSAFMHMLRDEKNQEYRLVIKNTIEFDPEVLKRYVNFMNNPDERTAVDQFGKGDKYFGVAVMMSTLPGLPMFGHGQLEGFTERYGMEFRSAMLDETPDHWLLERHTREIFPLLHKRYLFAGVENFLLYDVFRKNRTVDENVFAYSNRVGGETALVVYNNSFTEARGKLRVSAAARDKSKDGLKQRTLAEGLNLSDESGTFIIYRDMIAETEYIRSARDVIRNGFEISLGAYKYAVYLNFRQVADTPDKVYATLFERLRGRGVPSVEQAIQDLRLAPLHAAFREMLNGERLRELREGEIKEDSIANRAAAFAQVLEEFGVDDADKDAFAARVVQNLEGVKQAFELETPKRASKQVAETIADLKPLLADVSARDGANAYAFVEPLSLYADPKTNGTGAAERVDEWQLGRVIGDALRSAGVADARIWQLMSLIKIGLPKPKTAPTNRKAKGPSALEQLFAEKQVRDFLNVNTFNGVEWFNREQFQALTDWLAVIGTARVLANRTNATKEFGGLVEQHAQWKVWREAEVQSNYQVQKLLEAAVPRKGSSGKGKIERVVAKPTKKSSAGSSMKAEKAASKRVPTKAKPATAKKASTSKPKVSKAAATKKPGNTASKSDNQQKPRTSAKSSKSNPPSKK